MTWTSGRNWGVNEALTAAKMNEISTDLNILGDAWPTYTPALTANVSDPTLGSSSISGSYRIMGKTGDAHMNVVIGAGFSAGTGSYRLSLPPGMVPLRTSIAEALGTGTVYDASANATYVFTVLYVSSTTVSLLNAAGSLTDASPVTWAVGDRISVHIPALELA